MRTYFEMNAALVAALAFFAMYRRALEAFKVRMSFQWSVRLAQALLLASVFVPLVLALMPAEHLPQLKNQRGRILLEVETLEGAVHGSELARPLLQRVRRLREPMGPQSYPEAREAFFEETSRFMALALALGMAFMFIRFLANWLKLRSAVNGGVVLRRLGRVRIVVSDQIATPFSAWLMGSAYVVIPQSLLAEARNFKLAVCHELQHHRQGDTKWALAVEGLASVFFLNPAIYRWKSEINELQEYSCDEALIGQRGVSRREYGSCLIQVAEAALENRLMLAGTASMAAVFGNPRRFKSFLRRRIEMFTQYESSRRRQSVGILLGTLSALATVAVAYGAQQSLQAPNRPGPNPGRATFEPKVQAIARAAIEKAVRDFKAKAGFVLVSDPVTGKLLAAANVSREEGRDQKTWALSYLMEPASAMKGLVTAAAIEQKSTRPDDVFDCEHGKYVYGKNLFQDWKPFDNLTVTEALAVSSNICGIKIGQRLGAAKLEKAVLDFGFGRGGSTAGFPEALEGLIPSAKQMSEEEYVGLTSTGYTLHAGFNITPLEMVQAYGAIANGGELMKPLPFAEADSSARSLRRVLSRESANQMKSVLENVVLQGTGKPARSRLYRTAGKTATAYSPSAPEHDSLGGERAVASFVGFAPVENPRVVVYVGVIDPRNADDHLPHGGQHAAPVFREVVDGVLQYLNVAPDTK